MSSRWSALLVWGLTAALAVFWALRLLGPSAPVPAHARMADNGPVLVGDLTRLLGAPPAKPVEPTALAQEAASRFVLTGVVATRTARDPTGPAAAGLALISVDGKPPQAYRVGDSLDPQLMLQAVGLRSARIGPATGVPGFMLSLPPPTPPATGVPSAGNGLGMGLGMVVPPAGGPPPGFSPPQMPMAQGQPPNTMPPPGMPPPGGPDTQNRGQIQ